MDSGKEPGMKRGKLPFLLFFLCDAAYMLTVTAMFSVFLYWQMSGMFRLFVLLSVLAGTAVWHTTAGRVVMAFSEAIVRLLRLLALWFLIRPACFLYGIFRKILWILYRRTVGCMVSLILCGIRTFRSDRIRRRIKKDISFAVENKRKSI